MLLYMLPSLPTATLFPYTTLFRSFFTGGPAGRPHFDLEAYVAARLAAAGVGRVEALGLDTYADETRFYSFRRATHRGEPNYGRDRKSTRLNSSHVSISYAVFCLKK